jgi:rhamnose utilization protein RhaD (predicted bifunctional aldolase and dehydrogenase)/NAD(P)-dependent dehydrogenase (short-subunit alcohol dehydrogenase family)
VWSDDDASAAIARWAGQPGSNEDVALRVYTSRLIGRDARLVLHGGGNTSVKTRLPDDTGRLVDVLCVKGSGWDLADIEPRGLPAVRLDTLEALRALPALSDEDMVNASRIRLLDASAPTPSVEMLLHAFLPARYIDHSHADAILAIVDQPDAAALCRAIWGETLAVVPYVMPGFALAKLAAEIAAASPEAHGMLLLQHGLFTWGDTAKQSYERHVDACRKAMAFVASRAVPSDPSLRDDVDWAALAPIVRGALGRDALGRDGLGRDGSRWTLRVRTSAKIRAFVDRADLADVAGRGPVTPDHVIRTKALPWILDPAGLGAGLDADPAAVVEASLVAYRQSYRAYFERQVARKGVQRRALDSNPRILLVPGLGIVAIGADRKSAEIAADIYEHTIDVIGDAERVGRYQALGEGDLFDMEYWSLEQAKLKVGADTSARPLAGAVVVVTGAASGIGAAIATRLRTAGAQLWLVDRDREGLAQTAARTGALFDEVDVTDRQAVHASIRRAVAAYGGIDGLVSNAGTAPQSAIDTCPPEVLRASLEINLLSHQWCAEATTAVLKAQGHGGFLLFNASKSAFNPGPGFGPYAIAKAGLVALMKQYAVEGGPFAIRANAINADRIRTNLLDQGAIADRAAARGLSTDDYYRSNLLGREVTADDVAEAMLALALAKSTTGAVVPVDGGNIAASPR